MSSDLRAYIRDIPDFPEPGIVFRDITPLLGHGPAFRQAIDWLAGLYADSRLSAVVGIESRGFIFASPLADRLGIGMVPVRKPGKLPADRHTEEYVLEYGSNILEIHRDALAAGQRVAIVDDLLATGGTAVAAAKLVELTGAEVHALSFLIELTELKGRDRLSHYRVDSLLRY
ncbi:MAG: adenine phosphoribosyltransferase [Dehalococcoidia bacterium]